MLKISSEFFPHHYELLGMSRADLVTPSGEVANYTPLCWFQLAVGFSLLLYLRGFLLINNAASLYKLRKWDMKYWSAAETPSDRPSYLQTDPDQLIHLLFLSFFTCWAKQTASWLYCISSIFISVQEGESRYSPKFKPITLEPSSRRCGVQLLGDLRFSLFFTSKSVILSFIGSRCH